MNTVAMAWARQMMSNCFPILGGTSIDQLKSNIEGLKVTLSDKQIAKLNDASPFSAGFPTAFFGLDPRLLADQQPVVPLLTTVSRTWILTVGLMNTDRLGLSNTLRGLSYDMEEDCREDRLSGLLIA